MSVAGGAASGGAVKVVVVVVVVSCAVGLCAGRSSPRGAV
jgi:hypothetical protein